MLRNALEATDAGGTVTVSWDCKSSGITFSVHNNTVIPQNIQLQIFNRSFSTKGNGRGLGAYTMKLLCARYLRGRIWFESTPETGTTFFAAFPIR